MIANNAILKLGVQLFPQSTNFFIFGYQPRLGVAGSYGNFIFFKNIHKAVFCSILAVPINMPTKSVPGFFFAQNLANTRLFLF